MKKLALLLAALGVVSAATYAAPELTVTSIGQEVEIEHNNGSDLTTAWLYNNVGLAYENWTIGFQGAKKWGYHDESESISSENGRIQFDVWNKVNDDLKLGVRFRAQDDHERYVLRYDYKTGMFLSAGDFWYQTNKTGGNDALRTEWFPVGVNLGPVTFKYLIDYTKTVGTVQNEKTESSIEHQLRAYAPLYKGERFAVSTEIRHTLHAENDMDHDAKYTTWEDFGRTRIYLKTSYNMTENLNVYANYAYEFGEKEGRNGESDPKGKNYYQNFTFGWSYKF